MPPRKRKRKRRRSSSRSSSGSSSSRSSSKKNALALPVPKMGHTIALLLISELRHVIGAYIDVPFVNGQALGMYFYAAMVPAKGEREMLASVALAMSIDTALVDVGLISLLQGVLPGGQVRVEPAINLLGE